MNKYTALISFKVNIEAVDKESAEHIAMQALPNHFLFRDSKGGAGKFLRGLMPVVYEADESGDKPDSYWRNR